MGPHQRQKSTQEPPVQPHQMPRTSIGLEVWITKRQRAPSVLVRHAARWAILLFPEMRQPTVALFAQAALPAPRRMGVERLGSGDSMRPQVIHTAMLSWRVTGRASLFLPSFLPSVPTEPEGARRPALP